MIILLTGTPGSGKSLFAVSKILELQKQYPDRQIYSDIEGLNIPGVLPSPKDWRETEENSIIFYDEAQQHERFRSGTSANKDEIVQALQVHRHSGHDIWFITQSPRFLNAFVLDLVGEHYHLHRPYGAKLASVYYWRTCQKQPTSEAAKERSENNFNFVYPKEVFKLYKSATAHHVKFKIPTKIWGTFLIAVLMSIFVWYMATKPETVGFFTGKPPEKNKEETEQTKANDDKQINSSDITSLEDTSDIKNYCRHGKNIDKPECVKWFDNLTANNASVQETNGQVTVTYDPSKPFETEQLQKTLQYQVTAKPVFSGCTKMNGKYVAYTQQGTRLAVDPSDCKRLIEDSDRPFNYFKQEQQNAVIAKDDSSTPGERSVSYLEEVYQAQNYVEPHLQAKTVNGANSSSFSF